ncbi:MAG: hypothetical protein ABIF22_03055 [bacterium]
MKRYRAVLWNCPESKYEQLPKTEWYQTFEMAQKMGKELNIRRCSDFFVRIEEEKIEEKQDEKKREPNPKTTKPHFLIWNDWQNEKSHGMTINIPEDENPKEFAHHFLCNHGDLGKFGFLIIVVGEIQKGETFNNF